jgi:transposase
VADRYIGLDVHGSSSTFAIVGPSGKRLRSAVVETNGACMTEFLKMIPGTRHLCFEEGTQSEWLYEILSPHVHDVCVLGLRERRRPAPKSDEIDAFAMADTIRLGAVESRVYKAGSKFGRLRDLARVHAKVVGDVVRVKNRLRSLYRSRAISTGPRGASGLYRADQRAQHLELLPKRTQAAAAILFDEHDVLAALRKRAEKELLAEARKYAIARILETCPGLGALRVAHLLPIVVTPHRFRTKRQFWAYCGLGIVTRSSADWVRGPDKSWRRGRVPMTRGLNRNCNGRLKSVFKGAATTVIGQRTSPLYEGYARQLDNGTKPDLAKLTLARKIAAIALAMWKSEEVLAHDKIRSTKT